MTVKMKEVAPKFYKWLDLKELRKLGFIELFFFISLKQQRLMSEHFLVLIMYILLRSKTFTMKNIMQISVVQLHSHLHH